MSILKIKIAPTGENNPSLGLVLLDSKLSTSQGLDAYMGTVPTCESDAFVTRRQLRKAAQRIGADHFNTKDILSKALDKVAVGRYNEAEIFLTMACVETVIESPAYSKVFLERCLAIVRLLQDVRANGDEFSQALFNYYDPGADIEFANNDNFMRPHYYETDLIRLAAAMQEGIIAVLKANQALGEFNRDPVGEHQVIDRAQEVFGAQALRWVNHVDSRYEWRDFAVQCDRFLNR